MTAETGPTSIKYEFMGA